MSSPSWITVVETAAYLSDATKLLSDEERRAVGNMIAQDPECGVIMKETGGVRKVRLALDGRGKSGGARVVYFFHNVAMPVYLLAIFAKNEKDNLSAAEKAALRKFVKDTVKGHEKKRTTKKKGD